MKIKYIIQGNAVIQVINIGEGYFVPAGTEFLYKGQIFDYKNDAMYSKLVRELTEGKTLSNFKSSPYYNYYVERLKIEHPEYII